MKIARSEAQLPDWLLSADYKNIYEQNTPQAVDQLLIQEPT